MEKNRKNSSNDKETNSNEKNLKDENILSSEEFPSHSPNRSKSAKDDESRSPNEMKSKNSQSKLRDKGSKDIRKVRTIRFEDDILDELRREFPSSDSKPRRWVGTKDEDCDEDQPSAGIVNKPDMDQKPAHDDDKQYLIKEGSSTEPQLPDMPSHEDILVEKGGPDPSRPLMGQKEFVANLLSDVLSRVDLHPSRQSKSKPVSQQNLLERRSTMMDVSSEIAAHFEKKDRPIPSFMIASKRKSSKSRASISRSQVQEPVESQAQTKSETLPPEMRHLRSGWQPPEEGGPQVGFRQRKMSWVGVYEEGRDYWTDREVPVDQEEVPFGIDQLDRTWYDLPVADEVQIEIPKHAKGMMSRAKLDAAKMKPPEKQAERADKERKRLFSFDDREPMPVKISDDLRQMFLEFCKADDLSAVQSRLSLLNADRSLEKVGLLDHKKLTKIHTGFCFIAAGGSKYSGLLFDQYKLFIVMLAETLKMPVFDFVNKLKLGYAGIVVLPDRRKV